MAGNAGLSAPPVNQIDPQKLRALLQGQNGGYGMWTNNPQKFAPNSAGVNYTPEEDTAREDAAVRAKQDAQNQTQEALARQTTNRTLELLRQGMGTSSSAATARLRAALAQRGMLDSGSYGAGIASINRNYAQAMAQGTMAAANQENDTLLRLIQAQTQRDWEARQAELDRQNSARISDRQAADARAAERRNQRNAIGNTAASNAGQILAMFPILPI